MSSPAVERVSKRERLSPYREGLPTVFSRVAKRGVDWGLPRNFKGYTASSEHEMSIGGAATKCFLSVGGKLSGAYIAKFAHKNFETETYTELFNNQLGMRLGFDMAHSGIAKLDGVLHFLSRSFRQEGERLVHGSLMVEMLGLAKAHEIEHIKTLPQQQGIFDVDFVETVMREFCGKDFDAVFESLIAMLVFDALIGSMDRHPRNWGVIAPMTDPGEGEGHFRFAPIYDSARALLWDLNDAKVTSLVGSDGELNRYIERSSPRIGVPQCAPKCNHFQLISYLASKHNPLLVRNLQKLPSCTVGLASDLLHRWPFREVFSFVRRQGILKIIQLRFDRLMSIA